MNRMMGMSEFMLASSDPRANDVNLFYFPNLSIYFQIKRLNCRDRGLLDVAHYLQLSADNYDELGSKFSFFFSPTSVTFSYTCNVADLIRWIVKLFGFRSISRIPVPVVYCNLTILWDTLA